MHIALLSRWSCSSNGIRTGTAARKTSSSRSRHYGEGYRYLFWYATQCFVLVSNPKLCKRCTGNTIAKYRYRLTVEFNFLGCRIVMRHGSTVEDRLRGSGGTMRVFRGDFISITGATLLKKLQEGRYMRIRMYT